MSTTSPKITSIECAKNTDFHPYITHQDYIAFTLTFDQPVQVVDTNPTAVPQLILNDGSTADLLRSPDPHTLIFLSFAGPDTHNVPELKITGFADGGEIVSASNPDIAANLSLKGIHTNFPAVDMDTHVTAAQVLSAEENHQQIYNSWPINDLTDTPQAIADLLGGHTWADVQNNIAKAQAVGITAVEVQLPQNHEFEFALSDAFHLAEQQLALHGTESVAQQTKEIAQVEHHDWHL